MTTKNTRVFWRYRTNGLEFVVISYIPSDYARVQCFPKYRLKNIGNSWLMTPHLYLASVLWRRETWYFQSPPVLLLWMIDWLDRLISQGPKARICTDSHMRRVCIYFTWDASPWSGYKPYPHTSLHTSITSYRAVTEAETLDPGTYATCTVTLDAS